MCYFNDSLYRYQLTCVDIAIAIEVLNNIRILDSGKEKVNIGHHLNKDYNYFFRH